jgi:hypothetical protein
MLEILLIRQVTVRNIDRLEIFVDSEYIQPVVMSAVSLLHPQIFHVMEQPIVTDFLILLVLNLPHD